MLHNNCRICNQWPEIVWLETWIPLQIFQKSFLIGVIIRVYHSSAQSPIQVEVHPQDCFTQSNFFQVPFLLLPPSIPFRSLCLPLLKRGIPASPFVPLVIRKSFCNLLTAAESLRGGEPWYIASSGVKRDRSPTLRVLMYGGKVVARTRAGKELVILAVGGGAWLGTIMCLLSSYEVVDCEVVWDVRSVTALRRC